MLLLLYYTTFWFLGTFYFWISGETCNSEIDGKITQPEVISAGRGCGLCFPGSKARGAPAWIVQLAVRVNDTGSDYTHSEQNRQGWHAFCPECIGDEEVQRKTFTQGPQVAKQRLELSGRGETC